MSTPLDRGRNPAKLFACILLQQVSESATTNNQQPTTKEQPAGPYIQPNKNRQRAKRTNAQLSDDPTNRRRNDDTTTQRRNDDATTQRRNDATTQRRNDDATTTQRRNDDATTTQRRRNDDGNNGKNAMRVRAQACNHGCAVRLFVRCMVCFVAFVVTFSLLLRLASTSTTPFVALHVCGVSSAVARAGDGVVLYCRQR